MTGSRTARLRRLHRWAKARDNGVTQGRSARAGAVGKRLGEVKFGFVDVAPAPGFAGLDRTHDGMLRAMEVLGGVFVLGRVTATDVSAFEAQAEMDPGVTHFQTFFAAVGVGSDFVDVREMRAGWHGGSPGEPEWREEG